jgi:hypothetical protein
MSVPAVTAATQIPAAFALDSYRHAVVSYTDICAELGARESSSPRKSIRFHVGHPGGGEPVCRRPPARDRAGQGWWPQGRRSLPGLRSFGDRHRGSIGHDPHDTQSITPPDESFPEESNEMSVSSRGGSGVGRDGRRASSHRAHAITRLVSSAAIALGALASWAPAVSAQDDVGIVASDESVLRQPESFVATDGMAEPGVEQVAEPESGWASGFGLPGFMPDLAPAVAPLDAPRWTAQIDALMLWQGGLPNVPLLAQTPSGLEVLNANDAGTGLTVGPRYTLARTIGCNHAIEGSFFDVGTFNGQGFLGQPFGPYELRPLGGLPPYSDIETAQLATFGRIKSAELNWRRWNGGSINWLAGFRWVDWRDSMNLDYTFARTESFGSGGIYSVAGNNLYGGQVGADIWLWNDPAGVFRLDGVAKTGVFYNSNASQKTFSNSVYQSGLPGPSYTAEAGRDTVSFVGEAGLTASVAITRWLAWRAGYTVIWLGGVATAPRQLAVTDLAAGTATVNTSGTVFLHGATTGLEARW